MKRILADNENINPKEVRKEILHNEASRYIHRLHAILFVSNGMKCSEAGELLGHHSTTIQRWVSDFNSNGFSGLYDKKRSGRPSSITKDQWDNLLLDLRKLPKKFVYNQKLWDGKILVKHLYDRYGVTIGIRQSQRIIHKFGSENTKI